jgi:hypothetical protein
MSRFLQRRNDLKVIADGTDTANQDFYAGGRVVNSDTADERLRDFRAHRYFVKIASH